MDVRPLGALSVPGTHITSMRMCSAAEVWVSFTCSCSAYRTSSALSIPPTTADMKSF